MHYVKIPSMIILFQINDYYMYGKTALLWAHKTSIGHHGY